MPVIYLEINIKADINIVFDLARSVDLHKISTAHTKEEAVAGKVSGLVELNDTITWKAKHFGITQMLTSKITEFDQPYHFTDEMVKGAFKRFVHQHDFVKKDDFVTMKDVFLYTAPLGALGRLADKLFLKNYMTKFLTKRNEIIKQYAESEKWKDVL